MSDFSGLLGLEAHEAKNAVEKLGYACKLIRYESFRPSEDAGSARIVQVRVREREVELISCEFKTTPESQGR